MLRLGSSPALAAAYRAAAPLAVRCLSTTAATKARPLETSLGADGIMTITFANEKKLNAWTEPMMRGFFDVLMEAQARSDVAGVVVTGQGKYYSAGVDLSNLQAAMSTFANCKASPKDVINSGILTYFHKICGGFSQDSLRVPLHFLLSYLFPFTFLERPLQFP